MKGTAACLVLLWVWLAAGICGAGEGVAPDVRVSSTRIAQGGIGRLRVWVDSGETPQARWMKKPVLLVRDDRGACWQGFFGADLESPPGLYGLRVDGSPVGPRQTLDIEVEKKDYGVRRLTLPREMVDLDAGTLARVREESRVMNGLWDAAPGRPLWRGAFVRPIPGALSGTFGRRSVINNQPRSPHSGVDLRAARGTPVKAINNGKVALEAEHFFTGKTVVLDHGGGIFSMYFHLDRVLAEGGRIVKKGQVIGFVGSTGRSTGPHLHWGIRMNGARVDPMELLAASLGMEE